MRIVKYQRHEFHQNEPDFRQASLPEFVMDVPYLIVRGVIPPRHILNEVLSSGGGDAGMNPSAEWEPFQVSEEEYAELAALLIGMDLEVLRQEDGPRYVPQRMIVDESLADSSSHLDWVRRCAEKYPESEWLR